MISIAILASLESAYILEWMGAFLAFYGLSTITGTRTSITLSTLVLVAGSLGDIVLLDGLTPLTWTLTNYMVFIHSAAGTLTNHIITNN
ncbi:unnamed protein product [marine sediment metagenome]|uniref:Uncharacterized protein n=1 Tax=marine sediment metagenome TaxID=412755 RepID=X1BXE7_9ZZZZ